jgi:ABC-2 type transport system ATP-binding protein
MDAVVEVVDLSKRYGSRLAVDAITLRVRPGEVYGFLGPNGAGKTTTLRMLLGLIRPTAGSARVLGSRPGSPAALSRMGSLIEGPAFYPYLSGRANLAVLARYAGVGRHQVDRALATVELSDRADDRFSTYSLGMKQRLGVAAALLKDPELVILDEPTNGLDPAGMRDMRDLIRALGTQGRTVVLSSHLMGEVQQICDRVAVINRGRIVTESSVVDLRGAGELVVAAAPSDRAREVLVGLPAVTDVRAVDGRLRVSADPDRTADVTRALVLAGVDVSEVRRVERQLEDVFLEMTEERDHVDETV